MPRAKEIQFRNVAVPIDVYEKLRQLADFDDRSLARELAFLIKEAHSQILGSQRD